MRNAAGERTAIMYYLGGERRFRVEDRSRPTCRLRGTGPQGGFPVMVDAANMLPPWDTCIN